MFAKTHSVLHWLHKTREGNKLLLMKGVGANFEYTEWKKLVGLGWREEIKLFLFYFILFFTFSSLREASPIANTLRAFFEALNLIQVVSWSTFIRLLLPGS